MLLSGLGWSHEGKETHSQVADAKVLSGPYLDKFELAICPLALHDTNNWVCI